MSAADVFAVALEVAKRKGHPAPELFAQTVVEEVTAV